MEEHITMSRKEVDRLEVIQAVVGKRLKQREAAGQLGLTVRQVKRLVRRYREAGASGLVSGTGAGAPTMPLPRACESTFWR